MSAERGGRPETGSARSTFVAAELCRRIVENEAKSLNEDGIRSAPSSLYKTRSGITFWPLKNLTLPCLRSPDPGGLPDVVPTAEGSTASVPADAICSAPSCVPGSP